MSKAQKLISGIFALAFALAIAPTASFAATNYDLSVNGEHFTSEKLTIQCGEGTATYDPATQNLTLNNASITNAVDYGGIDSELTGDLTITLQGSNQITFNDNIGIMATGNVIFHGSGSLAISVAGDTMDGISVAGDVTIRTQPSPSIPLADSALHAMAQSPLTTRNSLLMDCMQASMPQIWLSRTAAP